MRINQIQQNYQNNTNFKGFKNIIGDKYSTISIMSMQLDNVGTKDLDAWKAIQKMLKKTGKTSDVLTFGVLKMNEKPDVFIENFGLITDNVKPSTQQDNLIIKAYGLIASLTKRIMNSNTFEKNAEFREVVMPQTVDNLEKILGNRALAYATVSNALYSETPRQEVASDINQCVDDVMKDYF